VGPFIPAWHAGADIGHRLGRHTPRPRVIGALDIHRNGRTHMASNAKKKTTMKKMNRENAVRERQLRKQEKKEARKQAAAQHPGEPGEAPVADNA
jgi:hypothetical protein